MKHDFIYTAVASMLLSILPAKAQDAKRLQDTMNAAEICKPLKLGTSAIRPLIPYKIPDIIPDADIGIDKDRHEVKSIELTDASAKIVGIFGCQPSDEGVPFKPPFDENPDNWRITDNFECNAQISNKIVSSMACTTSGTVGNVLAAAFNINEKMKAVLQSYLQM